MKRRIYVDVPVALDGSPCERRVRQLAGTLARTARSALTGSRRATFNDKACVPQITNAEAAIAAVLNHGVNRNVSVPDARNCLRALTTKANKLSAAGYAPTGNVPRTLDHARNVSALDADAVNSCDSPLTFAKTSFSSVMAPPIGRFPPLATHFIIEAWA